MKNFWVSWRGLTGIFELHWPWWLTGYGDGDTAIFCAAVRAADEAAAMEIVRLAHDVPPEVIEFRFIEERPEGWTPYCDRFRKVKWMPEWPPVPGSVRTASGTVTP